MTRDDYHLAVCNTVATKSSCLSRKIGCIMVRDNCILCTGYNGPPRGVPHCGWDRWYADDEIDFGIAEHISLAVMNKDNGQTCPRQLLGAKSGERLDLCPAGHAERNVLITAARHGIKTNHATLFMNCPIPCAPCLVEIINAGIKEIVVTKLEYYDKLSPYLVTKSDLRVRVYNHSVI